MITIELDPIKFSWILEYPESSRQNIIENILSMGKMVYDTTKMEVSPVNNNNINQINGQICQINDKIDSISKIEDLIIQLTGNIKTSSFKGKIGENFIEQVLEKYFPDDNIMIKAKEGHESDIHFVSQINDKSQKILIESKMYNSMVNTKQIEKFYDDMERTGIKYGIFISLTSSIIGHHRLEYKSYKDKHIIFLPNAGFDGSNIVYAILFLKTLFKLFNTNNHTNLSEMYFNHKMNKVKEILGDCFEFWQDFSKVRFDIYQSKNQICNIMDGLYKQAMETEIKIKALLMKMEQELEMELLSNSPEQNESELSNINMKYIDKCLQIRFLENLRSNKDKFMEMYNNIFDFINDSNYELKLYITNNIDDNIWYITKNQKFIGQIKRSKTKLEFINDDIKLNLKNGFLVLKKIVEMR